MSDLDTAGRTTGSAGADPSPSTQGAIGAQGTAEPSTWWFVWRLVRNQPVRYVTSLCVWISIWSLPLLLAVISERYFDGLQDQAGGWSLERTVVALGAYTLGYVAAIVTGMRLHASLMVRARSSVQRGMLRWIFALPAADPVAESDGEVVSRFRDDTEHVQDAFDLTVDFIGSLVTATISVALLAAVDLPITLAVSAPILLVVVVIRLLGARIRAYRVDSREMTEQVTGFLGETFAATAAVKVAGAERTMLAHLDQLNVRRRTMMVRDRTLEAVTEALVNNTADVVVGIALLLAAGGIGGPDGLTVGEVVLFTLVIGRMTWAAHMTGSFLARVTQADVSIDRITSLLDGAGRRDVAEHHPLEEAMRPLVRSSSPRVASRPAHDRGAGQRTAGHPPLLRVRGLTAEYPEGDGVAGIDLDVPTGSLVVVTGRIGSGKTTLLRAVLGLLPATAGSIELDGDAVDDPGATFVPPIAAYTPQVPRLFSMDLRDNLAMGLEVGDDRLLGAMQVATLDVDLDAMPRGLDTLVGPRGVRLSGGQVQRAAAARMLVRQPRLLVFDDLSSALDVETEATLWDRLFAEDQDTTALVVSHRRPALRRADQILVLDGGRVVARGTASQLREQSPLFAELWGA